MFRRKLPRIYELKDLLADSSHPDAYFRNFEEFLQNPTCFKTFVLLEKELQGLDPDAWAFLKGKASPYLNRKDPKGRGWQQLFDFLGEASAYNYLKEPVGCSSVCFIPEARDSAPDLEGVLDRIHVLCEVKTINISDDEVGARRGPAVVRNVNNSLENGFLRKLDGDITKAKSRLQSYDPNGEAQHLVYIKICFDDWVGHYEKDYLQQIDQHLLNHPPLVKVVVSAGFSTEVHVVAQQ